jgi:hypothetical protein
LQFTEVASDSFEGKKEGSFRSLNLLRTSH